MVVADSAILHGQNRASNRCGTLHGDGCALARVGDRMGTLTWVPGTYLLQKWKCNYQGHEDLSAFPARMAAMRTARAQGSKGVGLGWAACCAPAFHVHPAISRKRYYLGVPQARVQGTEEPDCAPSLTPTRILVHTHKVALHLPLKKVWSHKPPRLEARHRLIRPRQHAKRKIRARVARVQRAWTLVSGPVADHSFFGWASQSSVTCHTRARLAG